MNMVGLAEWMRKWIFSRERPFDLHCLYAGLNLPAGEPRTAARKMLRDFVGRGEVKKLKGEGHPDFFIRVQGWRSTRKSEVRPKVLKAMRLFSPFTLEKIRDLTNAEHSYVYKITKELLSSGYLARLGKEKRPSNTGRDVVYGVVDSDRFRMELLP